LRRRVKREKFRFLNIDTPLVIINDWGSFFIGKVFIFVVGLGLLINSHNKMKKQTMFLLILSVTLNITLAQNWQWANSGGSIFNLDDFSRSMCKDQNGNIYIAGSIQGSESNDNLHHYAIFNSDTIPVNGFNDIFLAKYDPNGNQLWVKHFGGSYDDWLNQQNEIAGQITYSPLSNSIYFTGTFLGICSFEADTLYSTGGGADKEIFIAKFDLNGNCIWAKSAGSYGLDNGSVISVTPSGNILVGGKTKSSSTFDTIHISNGGFLAMYDDNGICKWVKNIFSGLNHFPYGATAEILSLNFFNNDIFITGRKIADSLYIDTVLFTGTNIPSTILARLDSSGNVKWARNIGWPNSGSYGLTLDNNGNCYLLGTFGSGYTVIENDTLHSTGSWDLFFTKYDQNGNFQWVRQSNATDNAVAGRASSDGNGNVYITGSFSGNATFGTYNVTANTSQDMFVARYNSDGDCLGINHEGQGAGTDVLTNSDGSCMVTGTFFNSMTLGTTTLTSHGYTDIFTAKMDVITGTIETKKLANNQLIIYANPNEGKCNIKIPDEFLDEKNLTLFIYDNSGKLIQQTTLEMSDGKIKLDIEHEAKGMYNVILSNGEKTYNGKLVFE
jgi:hypothetical protein